MSTEVTFSATGELTTTGVFDEENPIDDNRHSIWRNVVGITVANSEVVTITHSEDRYNHRNVRIIDSTGKDVVISGTTIASVVRTDHTTTTITVGSAGVGSYTVIIEY